MVGIQLYLDNYAFGVKVITNLGFIIEACSESKADPEKFKVILEWEEPVNVPEVRSFLDFANFYCKFISNFSGMCKLLNNLTKNGYIWDWSYHRKSSFSHLKHLLTSSPVLMMISPNANTILQANFSGYAI